VAAPLPSFEIHPLLHASGARTYVVVEPASREALVVDPILEDVGEVLRVVGSRRATLRWVVDTHLHGDHLSGATWLRDKTGAEIVMGAATDGRVATRKVTEGDVLALGASGLRVRLAPGVAPDAIVLQGPDVLFTGDTLLVGTIGVRDVPGDDGTALYDTLQRVFDPLPDETVLHPGHDDMGRSRTTIKAEKRGNRWMREKDRENFLMRWTSDPRPVSKVAKDIAAANLEGVTSASPELAPVASVGTPAKGAGPVLAPQGMGAAKTGGLVPSGLAEVCVVVGAVSVAGCALGFLVHPLLHLIPGVVGLLAIVLGMVSASRRPKKTHDGFFYTGPQARALRR